MLETLKKLDDDATPMDMLHAAYADAPDAVKAHLNRCAEETLMIELPKMMLLAKFGPIMPVDKMPSLVKVYEGALADAEKKAPTFIRALTATARDAGTDVAAAIDTAFRRVLLTDTVANHEAYVTAMACHAKLVKCIADIALTEEQTASLKARDDESTH